MNTDALLGLLIVVAAGLVMGTSPWPLKLMKHYKYEQFGFISMITALLLLPWLLTSILCVQPLEGMAQVPIGVLIKGNLFSMAWGIAQVLAMLCFIRIGVSLTYGILCAVGAGVGVLTPMVFKATGAFQDAPSLLSKTGAVVILGVLVLLAGVVLAAAAGFGREKLQNSSTDTNLKRSSGSFAVGLLMVVVSGILSAGWGFAFAYTQGPITEIAEGLGSSPFAAKISVWAMALIGAAAVNIAYPAWLMTRNRSWSALLESPRDAGLSLVYGLLFFIPSLLLGEGMVMLGALGASVGWGVVQGTLILGGQMLGFITGEWRGVHGRPRRLIYSAIIVLIVAVIILASANGMN